MTADPRPAAGTVDVTMTGSRDDVADLADFVAELIRLAGDPDRIKIVSRSGPHPRRRSPSHRVYITVRIDPGATSAEFLTYEAGAQSVKTRVESALSRAIREVRAEREGQESGG